MVIGSLFFSREESRMHVHILPGDGEAKYWLEPEIELSKQKQVLEKTVERN